MEKMQLRLVELSGEMYQKAKFGLEFKKYKIDNYYNNYSKSKEV